MALVGKFTTEIGSGHRWFFCPRSMSRESSYGPEEAHNKHYELGVISILKSAKSSGGWGPELSIVQKSRQSKRLYIKATLRCNVNNAWFN